MIQEFKERAKLNYYESPLMINLSLIKILISYSKIQQDKINVLYGFSGIFYIKEREVIHNTFILANLNYCSIIWHFDDKSSTKKLENV